MSYNLGEIRKLIIAALDDDEFTDLCLDHFRPVHDKFTSGQTKPARVRMLVEYADRRREIPKLLKAVKEINPHAYAEFEPRLGVPREIKQYLPEDRTNSEEPTQLISDVCDILILAANPRGTDPLQFEREANLISQEIQKGRTSYTVKIEHAVRIEELSRHLLRYEPLIVHFSGHGSSKGEIILENEQGQAHPISAETLARLLAVVQGRTECVVLNACFSLERADALAKQVNCVIGMTEEIDDESAMTFALGFYRGLSFDKGYYAAFELGREQIQLMNLPDKQVPQFFTRDPALLEVKVVKPRVTRTYIPLPTIDDAQIATLYPLWFGTNRHPIDLNNPSKGFSGERDTQIHYGACQVAVPKSHKIGSIGSPWWKRLLTLNDDRLHLDRNSLKVLAEVNFWADVKQSLQERDPNERMALIFIHGFNVSFEGAALRAAQIGFDLQVPGITAFYSWPSKGKLTGYAADEATIEASERYIAEFLVSFAESSGAERIHIVAHSMGNRGLLRSMQRILQQARDESQISFGQIFLAAPDVDPDVFRDLARSYEKLAQRTTLYISSQDKALATSGIIHDYPRVGFYPPVTIIPGIDTVEVSNIDLTFLGHGYYAEARDLLQDMHNLLIHNTPPDKRFGLREAGMSNTEKFWVIGK